MSLTTEHPISSAGTMKTMKKDSVSGLFTVVSSPRPDVTPTGARIKVCFAGACIIEGQVDKDGLKRLRLPGVKDTSLFQGFEVSGVVDAVGSDVPSSRLQLKDRVIVYSKDQEIFESRFSEYIVVKDVEDLIKVPDDMAMHVAATLPAGGLRSHSAVMNAKPFIEKNIAQSENDVIILIVGAGAMGLLTLTLAKYYFPGKSNKLYITVADTNLKKLEIAKKAGCSEVIHWDEAIHEEYIEMRTRDGCRGGADIVIDLVSSPRSIGRSMKILRESGVLLVGGNSQYEVMFDLARIARLNQSIVGVPYGSREQLRQLVDIFASQQVQGLAINVFPLTEADRVFDMLSQCQLDGRAVFEVCGNHRVHDSTTGSKSLVSNSVAMS